MQTYSHLKIILIVGLPGSGKTTAAHYFGDQGIPKVAYDTGLAAAISQVEHLAEAGQHVVIIDGNPSWQEYQQLKEAFQGDVTLLALQASHHLRYHRLEHREHQAIMGHDAHESDLKAIADQKTGPIAFADHIVINDSSVDELNQKLSLVQQQLELT